MDKNVIKKLFIYTLVVMIMGFKLYVHGYKLYLNLVLLQYRLPKNAVVVLAPKAEHLSGCCSSHNQTRIEMVYRVPAEAADSIELGEYKGMFKDLYVQEYPDYYRDECGRSYHVYGVSDYPRAEEDKDYYYVLVGYSIYNKSYDEDSRTWPLYFMNII